MPYKLSAVLFLLLTIGCKKGTEEPAPPVEQPRPFNYRTLQVGSASANVLYHNVPVNVPIRISFPLALDPQSIGGAVTIRDAAGTGVNANTSLQNGDSVLLIQSATPLANLTKYNVAVSTSLRSKAKGSLQSSINLTLITAIDSSDKFPRITDEALLTLVQQQTFKYFWDFAHPVSGLARERNTSGDIVTSGGSGFGLMSIVTGIHRNFITRQQGLERVEKIVDFLQNKAQKFHGAFPHWMNGSTGVVAPFSAKDNGADLVETSFLMQGLLTARQYFNGANVNEVNLRQAITALYNGVEWSWFRKADENLLYWHWSPQFGFDINLPIRGWNECLVTYVLAAASPTHTIPKVVYDNGFAQNGGMKNGNIYYGVTLPLGPATGGPLFFSHYSFLGLDPNGLVDAYANYKEQNVAHSQINFNYSVANPRGYFGYSREVWGLTASDNNLGGYSAHAPDNDLGVITPTAALSSMPYTPLQSMDALRFFYYKLGDKLWREYGFVDAFNLTDLWFADSFLAIDQGPMIIMIENHRSKLLWNLFMSAPEVKTGLLKLGFQSPYL